MVAERYLPMDVDKMHDSWDELISLEPQSGDAPKSVENRFQKRSGTDAPTFRVIANIPNQPRCHYCGKPFTPNRSNQKFCDPDRERKLNWQRRQALIMAVSAQFRQLGLIALDMGLVAKRCIDAAYEWFLGAMQKLGWTYSSKKTEWVKGAST